MELTLKSIAHNTGDGRQQPNNKLSGAMLFQNTQSSGRYFTLKYSFSFDKHLYRNSWHISMASAALGRGGEPPNYATSFGVGINGVRWTAGRTVPLECRWWRFMWRRQPETANFKKIRARDRGVDCRNSWPRYYEPLRRWEFLQCGDHRIIIFQCGMKRFPVNIKFPPRFTRTFYLSLKVWVVTLLWQLRFKQKQNE